MGTLEEATKELLDYLEKGQYEKDFDATKSAVFMKIMDEREKVQKEHFREQWYKYMKYKLPELFEFLEKDPKRYVLKPSEDGETFNIEVKIYGEENKM